MNKKDLEHYEKRLQKEKITLEAELKSLGHKNATVAGGWEAEPSKLDVDNADENELADKIEDFEENTAILEQLETQLQEVAAGLERIEKGTFGICEKCGQQIEKDRLDANTSAKTCIKDMSETKA